MAVFKVKVRSVTIYDSHIMVAAKDEAEAFAFLRSTAQWKRDGALDLEEEGTLSDDKIPLQMRKLLCLSEAPQGWRGETIPWNSQQQLEELLPI